MEVSLLDYGGTTNKDVDYSLNEDRSGIYLRGFTLGLDDVKAVNPELKIPKNVSGNIGFRVLDTLQYKPWQWGKVNRGAGQIGIYKLKDQKDNVYFAVIKDYRASEGDWRIAMIHIESSEQELKDWLMCETIGTTFIEYIDAR